jgi:hypothetical protein
MQSNKEYLKNKARQFAKQTWAGPGKFGVFIIACIIVVATFESLGLSNREKNLEIRSVQNIVFPVIIGHKKEESPKISKSDLPNMETFNQKLKISAQLDSDNRNLERENLLMHSAIDQFLNENNVIIENPEKKVQAAIQMILNSTKTIIQENVVQLEEDFLIADF